MGQRVRKPSGRSRRPQEQVRSTHDHPARRSLFTRSDNQTTKCYRFKRDHTGILRCQLSATGRIFFAASRTALGILARKSLNERRGKRLGCVDAALEEGCMPSTLAYPTDEATRESPRCWPPASGAAVPPGPLLGHHRPTICLPSHKSDSVTAIDARERSLWVSRVNLAPGAALAGNVCKRALRSDCSSSDQQLTLEACRLGATVNPVRMTRGLSCRRNKRTRLPHNVR